MVYKIDGVETAVRFYYNHGALRQISERSGVSVEDLRAWMEKGEISEEAYTAVNMAMDRGESDE